MDFIYSVITESWSRQLSPVRHPLFKSDFWQFSILDWLNSNLATFYSLFEETKSRCNLPHIAHFPSFASTYAVDWSIVTIPFDSHHLWLVDIFLLFITHDEVRFVLFRPVFIGRSVMKLWMGDASVHELYTAACGLYFIWLVCRLGSVLFSWVPLGWGGVALKLFEWFVLVTYRLPLCVLGVSCSPISLPGSSFQFFFLKLEKGKRETL